VDGRKSSDYECLATYADDLMVWSQGIVRVIKSLESIYLLKDVGTPDYSLGGVLGEHWKWQVLGLSLSARTLRMSLLSLKIVLERSLRPLRHL
jgi:hypothetical protein